jgi:formylglycine-generating enzyme
MTETASIPFKPIQVLDNLTLVKIPAGSFTMGSIDDSDSQPLTNISFKKDFYLSQYPVTQALWEVIMAKDSPSGFKDSNRPVEKVSWNTICQTGGFLDKLNKKRETEGLLAEKKFEGMEFALPSEAQWEYAARGGPHWQDGLIYAGSNAIDEVTWYNENSHQETKPVGLKAPNQLGLYDMSGNVWEWCADDWMGDYKGMKPDGRPRVKTPERATYRVMRGGSYFNFEHYCRCSSRLNFEPAFSYYYLGFRIVLCPQFSGSL